jgi:tRNA (guanine10-N2)-dimethyltransferase
MLATAEESFLFELSGEHATLPFSELMSTVAAECDVYRLILNGPGYAIVRFPRDRLQKIVARLALSHRVGRYLGVWTSSGFKTETDLAIPDGTVAVRVRRFKEMGPEIDSEQLTKKIALNYVAGRKVDLENPDAEVRGLISDHVLVHVKLMEVDRQQFDLRKVKERPYFSPISLHPRYARTVLNLTGSKAGDTILDPFCGTGGLLIEAALLGMKVYGSDLSPEMIEGCAKNLEHFGLKADRLETIDIGRVGEVFGEVDAVASDPPYGRSTSTNREALDSLYTRSLKVLADVTRPSKRLCLVFPREVQLPERLVLEERHDQKVHRSLSRHYLVLRRH